MSNTQWYIGNEKGIEHILTRPVKAAAAPQAHEISVAIHCNSINFHDLGVVMGMLPVEGERVLLSVSPLLVSNSSYSSSRVFSS